MPLNSSGRRDIRPFGPTSTQSRIPHRGLMKLRFAPDIGPRTPALGRIHLRLRLDEIGAPQFFSGKLSGRRDLNPGPLVPETSALPSCATARNNKPTSTPSDNQSPKLFPLSPCCQLFRPPNCGLHRLLCQTAQSPSLQRPQPRLGCSSGTRNRCT